MEKLDWRDYGAIPDGVFDCTDAINQSFANAMASGKESFGPAGEYRITDTLHWDDAVPRISGMGARTIIKPDNTNFDYLTIGNGTNHPIIGPAGWVRDLWISGPEGSPAASGETAGFKLNNAKFVEVRNVWVSFAPIGFDLVRNNFGSSFYNCRTYNDECRVGLVLRGDIPPPPPPPTLPGTEGAGNDIPFYNCWFHGRDAGIWIEGNNGSYHFHGGQVLCGVNASPSDDRGSLTLGKSLSTGLPMGSCSGTFVGVTFERTVNGHNIRGFGVGTNPSGFRFVFTGCGFYGGKGDGIDALSVLKITNSYNDSIILDGCGVNGVYADPVPVSFGTAGGAARPCYMERGTFGIPKFAGIDRDLSTYSMFRLSQVTRAHWQSALDTAVNQTMIFCTVDGKVLKSNDWGANFVPIEDGNV